jgi:hypothetical protein
VQKFGINGADLVTVGYGKTRRRQWRLSPNGPH